MYRVSLGVLLCLAACEQVATNALNKCESDKSQRVAAMDDAKRSLANAESKIAELQARLSAAKEGSAGSSSPVLAAAEKEARREPVEAGSRETIKIGLSLPTQQEEQWIKSKLIMVAEAKRLGMELRVQLAENDANRQLAQCTSLIEEGVKALIIAAQDTVQAAAIVERASKAGVPVIAYDRLIMNTSKRLYYVGFDGMKTGELQGEFLTKRVPKGNYIVMSGAPTDNNAKLFHEGAMRYIQPKVTKGDIKLIINEPVRDWKANEAKRLCEQALVKANNRVDAVLAPNDGTAGGCIEALEARGLAGKVPITGLDAELAAAVRINQGTQSMTIFKDTRLIGKKAVQMAYDLVHGKEIEADENSLFNNKKKVPAVLIPPVVVTKENLEEQLVNSKYINKQALYRK